MYTRFLIRTATPKAPLVWKSLRLHPAHQQSRSNHKVGSLHILTSSARSKPAMAFLRLPGFHFYIMPMSGLVQVLPSTVKFCPMGEFAWTASITQPCKVPKLPIPAAAKPAVARRKRNQEYGAVAAQLSCGNFLCLSSTLMHSLLISQI